MSRKDRHAFRQQITDLLQEGDFPGLVALAGRETGVGGVLLQFLYAPGDLLHWRAAEGLGQVAGAHPQQVRKLIGRLLYLLNEDSGSFGWGAAAALGEIGRQQISLVAEIIPMFYGFLEEEFSRVPMLWGLGRLGEAHPELLEEMIPLVASFLGHKDPQVRGLAAWFLGKVRHQEAAAGLKDLLSDKSPIQIYEHGELQRTTVAQTARKALAALGQH
jgi:HEAT repeat protein